MFASTSKGPRVLGIMGTMPGVPAAPAHGTRGTTHSVDGRCSVYRQINKEWNEIEGRGLGVNTYFDKWPHISGADEPRLSSVRRYFLQPLRS